MAYDPHDTIVAIASAAGKAARGIVRVSGTEAIELVACVFEEKSSKPWHNIQAAETVEGHLRLHKIDRSVACRLFVWPNARSYTREPIVEIHLPGAEPLVKLALGEMVAAGARLAEPGEFTLRAFLAGRVDLPQAEAVLGVIDATDERSLQTALDQLAGGLSAPLGQLREMLLNLLSHLEAGLDFAEDDIEFISTQELTTQLGEAIDLVESTLQGMLGESLALDRPRVVLRGRPNVGKSSLFNALIGRQSAIVADRPGTTRDYLVATVEFGGAVCELIDTAGVNTDSGANPLDALDSAAQHHARHQSDRATISIICIDGSQPLVDEDRRLLAAADGESHFVVFTKSDAPRIAQYDGARIETSSVTGAGLDELRQQLASVLVNQSKENVHCVAATAVRCGKSLNDACDSLRTASALAISRGGEELIAAEVRVALTHIGQVVGAVYTDDILDRIFSRFCIGK